MFFQSQSPGAFTQAGMPVPCIVLHCIYAVSKIIFAPIVLVLHTSLVDAPPFAVDNLKITPLHQPWTEFPHMEIHEDQVREQLS
ncbi:hypothetical protein BDN67DRAFT_47532 [Paxillus ammoniavirescens]|nr:hypothetical protein BDN67DRAFT_47532 [Paxillus ammoniavirescens]